MKTSVALAVVVSLTSLIIYIAISFIFVRDVDALIDRAQVAADREDMIEYLTTLKENMEKYDMTKGHFALIFKTPANDLALHYKTVNRLLERLDSIKNIPKSETAYQVALDDIRGTIRELPNPAGGYTLALYWWLIAVMFLIWALPVVVYSSSTHY